MPEHWSRRALLASIGAAAVAGCVSDDGAGTTPADSNGSTATPSPTPTKTPTDAPAETATPTETESPTDTATPRPDPETPDSVDSAWPMPDANPGRSRGRSSPTGPVDPIGELWTTSAGTSLSDPVVASETVYVGGDDGVVRALDARTGDERWRKTIGAPASTPWVLDGSLYVPTTDEVVALDANSGTIRWRRSTPSRDEFLVADHGVYWLADRESGLVAVNLRRDDGSERWRAPVDRCTRMPLHSFAGPDALYVSTGPYNHAPATIAADSGKLLENPSSCGADFAAEQFYRAGRIVAVDGFFGRVKSIPQNGGDGWNVGIPGGGHHGVCGGPDHVYVDVASREDSGLFALDVADGSREWRVDRDWTAVGAPVLAGETLLINAEDALRCFDPTDGTERWTMTTDRIGDGVAVADDLVYTTQGEAVRAFRSVESNA